jgi:hypothetical protein
MENELDDYLTIEKSNPVITLINEKNQLIEELKILVKNLNQNHEKELSSLQSEVFKKLKIN